MCCGQKRQQFQADAGQKAVSGLRPSSGRPSASGQSPDSGRSLASTQPVLQNPVSFRYQGRYNRMIKGPQTGYLYLLSPRESEFLVDERDVPQLLEESPEIGIRG